MLFYGMRKFIKYKQYLSSINNYDRELSDSKSETIFRFTLYKKRNFTINILRISGNKLSRDSLYLEILHTYTCMVILCKMESHRKSCTSVGIGNWDSSLQQGPLLACTPTALPTWPPNSYLEGGFLLVYMDQSPMGMPAYIKRNWLSPLK